MEEIISLNKPKYKALAQGNLRAFQPMHSLVSTIVTLTFVAAALLSAGFNLMKEAGGEE
jgi:hypothetical protein